MKPPLCKIKKRKRKSGCFLTHLPSKVRSFVWLRNALFSVKQVERGRRLLRLLSRTGLQNKRRRPSPCDVLSACTVFMRTVSSNAFSLLQVPKFFGLVQIFCGRPKFICIFWQSQTFCARQKDDLHSVNLVFMRHKRFWRGTICSQIFGLPQKIWTGSKRFGTCKRTRHKYKKIYILTGRPGARNLWPHYVKWKI